MRTLALALALSLGGCPKPGDDSAPDDSDADSDTDSDTDTDTDADADADSDADADTDADTDADADADTDTGRDGSYTGTLDLWVEEGGVVYWTDTCSAPITVQVHLGADPAIVGHVECTFSGDLSGTATVHLEADVAPDPAVAGLVTFQYGFMPADVRTWEGVFEGEDALTGTFEGHWKSGEAFVGWEGSFRAEREVPPPPAAVP